MIDAMPLKAKNFEGDIHALIVSAEVEANQYYDSTKTNSSKSVLNVTFQFDDPSTGDVEMFTQKYISPTFGGNGLYQQLYDLIDHMPDAEGEKFDEQKFVDKECIINFVKNEKGYNRVNAVKKLADKIEDEKL